MSFFLVIATVNLRDWRGCCSAVVGYYPFCHLQFIAEREHEPLIGRS